MRISVEESAWTTWRSPSRSRRIGCVLGRIAFALGLVAFVSPIGRSQGVAGSPDAALGVYSRMGESLLSQEILPRIMEALPAGERDLVRKVKVSVTSQTDPFRTGFVTRGGARSVEISAAFLAALDITIDATAFAIHSRNFRELPDYAADYGQFVREQWLEKSTPLVPIRLYPDYIGRPADEARSFRATPEYRELRLAMMRQTLAWMSAHYAGHLVLERRDPPRPGGPDAHEREKRIDSFASDLAHSAGFSPMPPLANTVLFSAIDHPQRDRSPHDWLCRAADVMEHGIGQLERDRRKASQPAQSGSSSEKLVRERADLERIRKSYGCARVEAGPSRPMSDREKQG